ncbi:hypothetical protein [Streptomyces gardneri]
MEWWARVLAMQQGHNSYDPVHGAAFLLTARLLTPASEPDVGGGT